MEQSCNPSKSQVAAEVGLVAFSPLLGVVGHRRWCGRSSSATWAKDLPSPSKTWEASKPYILAPFEKRGEIDQGILRFTWYSLIGWPKATRWRSLIGTPIGFLLGLSKTFTKSFDPIIQILRRSRRSHGCRWAWCCSRSREPAGRSSPSRCARCGRPC